MSLNWNWKEKVGEATFCESYNDEPRTYTVNLYTGNAYLIFIYEYEKDKKGIYSLTSFFADKAHMNRCLGIDKKYKVSYGNNMFEKSNSYLKSIRLNKSMIEASRLKEIVSAFAQAFSNIDIQIYSE